MGFRLPLMLGLSEAAWKWVGALWQASD